MHEKFPGSPPEAIDFLNRLLVFNPFFRMSLDEAIQHPFFTEIREKYTCQMKPEDIKINFDND